MDSGDLRPENPQIHHVFPQSWEALPSPLAKGKLITAGRLQTLTDPPASPIIDSPRPSPRFRSLDEGNDRESEDEGGPRASHGTDQADPKSHLPPPCETPTTMPSSPPYTRSVTPERQPSLDSAYVSLHSRHRISSDLEIQILTIRARERVEIHRGRVLRTRHLLNQSLLNVQELRDAFQSATDGLMRAVDGLMLHHEVLRDKQKGLEGLQLWHERLRSAKDDLGPAEWGIEGLFHRLNFEEEELENEERKFYCRSGTENIVVGSPLKDEVVLDRSVTLVDEVSSSARSSEDERDGNGESELVGTFLSRKGCAEQLKEELDEMDSQYYDLREEQAFRARHDLPLAEEKETFINDFMHLRRKLIDKLEAIEDEVDDMRQQCISEGLFTTSDYHYEPHDAQVEDIWGVVDDIHDRSPMRVALDQHPELLLRKTECKDKRDFVNTWLWQWVQDNAVERWRLRQHVLIESPDLITMHEASGSANVGDKWSELTLRLWNHDNAGMSMEDRHALSTMDALTESERWKSASQGTSLLVDLGDRPQVGVGAWETSQMMIRTLDSTRSGSLST